MGIEPPAHDPASRRIAARIRLLVEALPSETASVTLSRADLVLLLADIDAVREPSISGDLTVEDVASAVRRAPSTIRRWLISGALRGYKLNRRDWRVTRAALEEYLERQRGSETMEVADEHVDMGASQKLLHRERPDG